MLKDKNLLKAMEKFQAESFDAHDFTMEDIASLFVDKQMAEKAYAAQATLVKQHHNEVYGPMCAEKARLEIEMRLLELRFESVKRVNPSFAQLVAIANKS